MNGTSDDRIDAIIDGDSVAHDGQQVPNVQHLRLASYWCRDNRDIIKGTILVGPRLRHELPHFSVIDYEDMVRRGFVKQVPARYKADTFLLEYARLHPNAIVVSKDLFRDYKGTPLEIAPSRVWGFMIIGRDFIVPDLANLVQGADENSPDGIQ